MLFIGLLVLAPVTRAQVSPAPNDSIDVSSPSRWDLYKWYILGATAVCAIQGALIVAILIQSASRKRAEQRAQIQQRELTHLSRVATLGELTGTLAHELRQPLAAIRLNAEAARRELARGTVDRQDLLDTLDDIIRADERAADVIRRMRKLLRRNETQRQAVDLNDVVNDALSLLASEVAARAVTVTTELTPGLPAVLGDRVELQQVLLNLILNACDAMTGLPPARRMLRVQTEMAPDEAVQVAVIDQGPGVPVDDVDKIFDPFVTSKEQGLGLGLAISRSIIAAHQGRIWAERAAGTGATLVFRVPAIKMPALATTTVQAEPDRVL